MRNNKKLSLILIPLPILIGSLSSFLSGSMADDIKNPPLTPPDWVFPVVWSILYLMIGISAYLFIKANDYKLTDGIKFFLYQLALNFIWPIIFFRFNMFVAAVVILILLILLTIATVIEFKKKSALSAYLMLPYLAWLIFALYLNIGVAFLN